MGQSPSHPSPTSSASHQQQQQQQHHKQRSMKKKEKPVPPPPPPPKTDIFKLNHAKLFELIMESKPLTAEEIRTVAKSMKNDIEEQKGGNGFYAMDEDSKETDLAIKLIAVSKDIANLRFQLVPSKLKEPLFWHATISLVKGRLEEQDLLKHEQKQQQQAAAAAEEDKEEEPKENGTGKDKAQQSTKTTNANKRKTTTTTTKKLQSFPEDEVEDDINIDTTKGDVQTQLAAKDRKIQALERKIQQLEQQLSSSSSSGQKRNTTTTDNNNSIHKGKWIMDHDSRDFLSYPDEVKENMRKEKQKRLAQVEKDMKFILNSDNIQDTNGKWTCCGQTTYRATKCSGGGR